jgi:phosphoribosyl-dephospho-CoA transferase
MAARRRHQLVRLNNAGWASVLSMTWDEQARECLVYWATHHFPLVVTRQGAELPEDVLALGLPAPQRWERRRLCVQAAQRNVLSFDEFAPALAVYGLLPQPVRPMWRQLCGELAKLHVAALVYGSYGWQYITGLEYLRAQSDLDLYLFVDSPDTADAVCELLHHATMTHPRLDGEVAFYDGSAVAWREWRQWRAGRVGSVLVKRLNGVALERGKSWLRQPPGEHIGTMAVA